MANQAAGATHSKKARVQPGAVISRHAVSNAETKVNRTKTRRRVIANSTLFEIGLQQKLV